MHKVIGPEDMISALSGETSRKVIFIKWLEKGP